MAIYPYYGYNISSTAPQIYFPRNWDLRRSSKRSAPGGYWGHLWLHPMPLFSNLRGFRNEGMLSAGTLHCICVIDCANLGAKERKKWKFCGLLDFLWLCWKNSVLQEFNFDQTQGISFKSRDEYLGSGRGQMFPNPNSMTDATWEMFGSLRKWHFLPWRPNQDFWINRSRSL